MVLNYCMSLVTIFETVHGPESMYVPSSQTGTVHGAESQRVLVLFAFFGGWGVSFL